MSNRLEDFWFNMFMTIMVGWIIIFVIVTSVLSSEIRVMREREQNNVEEVGNMLVKLIKRDEREYFFRLEDASVIEVVGEDLWLFRDGSEKRIFPLEGNIDVLNEIAKMQISRLLKTSLIKYDMESGKIE